VLHWLAQRERRWPFSVSTTEAPHYRRVLIEHMRREGRTGQEIGEHPIARSFGIRDGHGVVFIAANGDVTPSGFLPLVAGNVRRSNVLEIYRDSSLFRTLRTPQEFRSRCGRCSFRSPCGGSRARAWAASGDVMGEDPLCPYQPPPSAAHAARTASTSPK
jgi:radical SAM protein with 4Fe4S-binding SPASM domain